MRLNDAPYHSSFHSGLLRTIIYYLTLFHLFKNLGDELDENKIVKSATGIRNTIVWRKLFKFQRDGAVGARPRR